MARPVTRSGSGRTRRRLEQPGGARGRERQHGRGRRRRPPARRRRPAASWTTCSPRSDPATRCGWCRTTARPRPVSEKPLGDTGRLRARGRRARGRRHDDRSPRGARAGGARAAPRRARSTASCSGSPTSSAPASRRRRRTDARFVAPAGPWDADARLPRAAGSRATRANAALTGAALAPADSRRRALGGGRGLRRDAGRLPGRGARHRSRRRRGQRARPRLRLAARQRHGERADAALRACPRPAARCCCPTTRSRSTTAACSPPAARARCTCCCARTGRRRRCRFALEAGMPRVGHRAGGRGRGGARGAGGRRRRHRDRRRRASGAGRTAGDARLRRAAAARCCSRRAIAPTPPRGTARSCANWARASWASSEERARRRGVAAAARGRRPSGARGISRAAGRGALVGALHARARVPRRVRARACVAAFDPRAPCAARGPATRWCCARRSIRRASDFAVSGAFLPLLHQCVRVLGRGTAAASLAPGDSWRAPGGDRQLARGRRIGPRTCR